MIRREIKFVHEGSYAAEIEVDLIEDETGWSPYLSAEDATKIDNVRKALLKGDLKSATALARIFRLEPIAV